MLILSQASYPVNAFSAKNSLIFGKYSGKMITYRVNIVNITALPHLRDLSYCEAVKMTFILSRQDIYRLIEQQPPLVEGHVNLDEQLQPNGIDLTLRELALLQSRGKITTSDAERQVADLAPLVFDGLGFIDLMPTAYVVTYNEIINLPRDIMALGRPRSSLIRSGITIEMGVWDAGYSGRSQSLMVVHNPQGIRLQRNARIAQLVFFRLTRETEGYQGVYQGENR
jgi:dUTP pyrophosphatase